MRYMDMDALDRHITGNYGEDQYEECGGCEDEENAPHTCDLAEEEDFDDDFPLSLEYDEGGWED